MKKVSLEDVIICVALFVLFGGIIALILLAGGVDTDSLTISEFLTKGIPILALIIISVIVLVKMEDDRDDYDRL